MVESVTIPASIKLFYFDLRSADITCLPSAPAMQPGWAEATRLMFKLRGIPFDDVTFSHEEWPKFKPNMPFGQVPVLEVDGQQLAQTAAIERYVAKLTGMYPDDPWQAAKGEELRCYCVECFELFNSARAIKDPEQQAAARRAVVDGPLQAKLAKLNEVLVSDIGPPPAPPLTPAPAFTSNGHGMLLAGALMQGALGPDTFVAGSKDVTVFDLPIFVILSFLCSGFLPGIPKDLLLPFPGLVAYHDRIARLPGIQAVYEGVTQGPRLAFKVGGVGAA
ncbi:hypothetical protein QJQ45_019614 [Haematococcus lacustris]|nr:hypothetical protein QJQ45_019614 [Haematococcus lacustris]